MSSASPARSPLLCAEGAGEALWFLGTLSTIKSSGETTGGRVSVVETLAAQGPASPMHLHRREDEWFYVMEGDLTFWVGGQVIEAPAGSFVYGPRDIPHTFTVASEEARFLLATEPAGFFDAFVRAAGEPAARREIPPAPTEPPDIAGLTALAATYGMEILGPPGIPS